MDYNVQDDLLTIKHLCEYSDDKLSEAFGVTRMTLSRWMKGKNAVSENHINDIYEFAFKRGIKLNKIKEQFYREDYTDEHNVILFHGAKTEIKGELSLAFSRSENDFGKGFYCGESLEQSAMFVAGYPRSSLYICKFTLTDDLKGVKFKVDREWMLAIAYFRNKIGGYSKHPIIQNIIKKTEKADYIIAPIADNRMFEIIDDFINGEITDVQCRHALSATNLGLQYVFTTEKSLGNIEILRHCYLANSEKTYYLQSKQEENRIGNDKVKLAKREYRGQGLYIDQILV